MVATSNRNVRSWNDELFTKVLSSAYSLQQQHDRIQSRLPAARLSEILAEVINTQSLIRNRKLDLDTAMQLLASRTEKLSGAAGAAIALLDGEVLDYKVGTGIAATLSGFKCRTQEIVSFERLKSDQMAETDTWQEKVLGGRVVANVLSAPVYRQNMLAGCIQLFSRHGHFDFDGRYICELMSGVVSHVIDKIPPSPADPRPEQPSGAKLEPASPLGHENRVETAVQKPASRTKLEWPGHTTRELEARLKKATVSVDAGGNQAKAPQGVDSGKFSQESARGPEQGSDRREDEAKRLSKVEKPIFRDKEDAKDKNPQIVSRAGHVASPSLGALALVPSDSHVPRPMPNPAVVSDRALNDRTQDEVGRRETLRDSAAAVVPAEKPGVRPSFEAINDEPDVAGSKTWNRLKRMVYPIFVLLFAIGVRIRAGAHNWPLEVIIYILLVLTTLELQSRWSKR